MTTALLDGDIIAYRSAVAAQEDIDWGDGQDGLTVDPEGAVSNALSMARQWTDNAGCDDAIVCLSCPDGNNWRRKIGPYKEARSGDKPVVYWTVVEALKEVWPIRQHPWLEGDDVMGILAGEMADDRPVIVSIDKDMKTIPGRLMNPIKDGRPKKVRPYDADYFWMTQTLMGDRVDGYPGCPGIGPKKAEKILDDCADLGQMWYAVVATFEAKGLTEADALLQARFARILRHGDYDYDKERIRLWHTARRPAWLTLH